MKSPLFGKVSAVGNSDKGPSLKSRFQPRDPGTGSSSPGKREVGKVDKDQSSPCASSHTCLCECLMQVLSLHPRVLRDVGRD